MPHAAETIDAARIEHLAGCVLRQALSGRLHRYLVGIAGIPGSGKSTFAKRCRDTVNNRCPGAAALVPMDGFHLPNKRLEEMGLLPHKGAPETFEVENYIMLLRRARDASTTFFHPHYDRQRHEPIWEETEAFRISLCVRVVFTEGNYLLLGEGAWSSLEGLFDECWFLETSIVVARRWLLARHRRGGRTAEDALAHYQRTDLPNTRTVLDQSRPAERRFQWPYSCSESGVRLREDF